MIKNVKDFAVEAARRMGADGFCGDICGCSLEDFPACESPGFCGGMDCVPAKRTVYQDGCPADCAQIEICDGYETSGRVECWRMMEQGEGAGCEACALYMDRPLPDKPRPPIKEIIQYCPACGEFLEDVRKAREKERAPGPDAAPTEQGRWGI